MPHPTKLIHFIEGHICPGLYPVSALTGRRGELRAIAGTVVFDGTRQGVISATWDNLAERKVTAELTGRPLQVCATV